MEVYDGQDSGSILKGTWTPDTVAMGPVSVTPSSGSGASQMFHFPVCGTERLRGDPLGFGESSTPRWRRTARATCTILRASNSIYLANDPGTAWLTPAVLGQSGTLQNSQCAVNIGASSAAGSGTSLALNLSLTFQSGFKGTKNVYMELYDGQDSGFKQKGTWTIP